MDEGTPVEQKTQAARVIGSITLLHLALAADARLLTLDNL